MLRILVVEDSASQREALIELLRERYWIRGVGGAREAETVLHAWPADVVLLDLVLGAACGVELLDALRRARADVHIIVTSGIAMIEPRLEGEWLDHERELRAAGADDFIPKPLELERLVQALDRLAHAKREPRHSGFRARSHGQHRHR
jgi:CheY-like chemotaxis protein